VSLIGRYHYKDGKRLDVAVIHRACDAGRCPFAASYVVTYENYIQTLCTEHTWEAIARLDAQKGPKGRTV
jgi:hypothetical protein